MSVHDELWVTGGLVNKLQLAISVSEVEMVVVSAARDAFAAALDATETARASEQAAAQAALERERAVAAAALGSAHVAAAVVAQRADALASGLRMDANAHRERARELAIKAWDLGNELQAVQFSAMMGASLREHESAVLVAQVWSPPATTPAPTATDVGATSAPAAASQPALAGAPAAAAPAAESAADTAAGEVVAE
ncbi:hypothetical protein T492DRAFT_864821, partial [Pavlovales sp. CCMP2436]